MFSKSRLKRALNNPDQAIEFIWRNLTERTKNRLTGGYRQPNDVSVLNHEWDILVILDACRYDMLADRNPFDAKIEKRTSQAPNTAKWFKSNFVEESDELLDDVVYVATIPNASSKHINPSRFAHLEEVFRYGWDEQLRTTPPDLVTSVAIQLHHEYPSKRLVVHYAQPHVPFVGHEEYESDLYTPDYVKYQDADVDMGSKTLEDIKQSPDKMNKYNHPFRSMKKGIAGEDEVWEAYCANLDYVLPHIGELKKYVDGRFCVSADHGNGMGEHGIYGHPPWGFTKTVLEVPWVCTQGDNQDPPERILEMDFDKSEVDATVEEQLSHLGYR
ncbi:hypothetical protein [Halorubrum halophilum]|uniref:hypothetical protein n=1 Tax=Halorubrum halophilum TaxID=413816 RepID=UPI00186B3AE4|nr:hypothetical protein [Halorubrum halophilum]